MTTRTAAPSPPALPAVPDWSAKAIALKKTLAHERQVLRDTFHARPLAAQRLRQHARLVDHTLHALWSLLPADLRRQSVLMAIGGYGRGALFPYSDVDTVIVLPTAHMAEEHRAALSAFEMALWDAGLTSAHSVRTLDDIQNINALDITVQTALVEHRYLAGSRTLYQQFANTLSHHLDFTRFFEGKRFEQEQRHLKYRDALYNLEPNLKESPGGLRDLHILRWLTRAAGLGNNWHDIAHHGLLTAHEARALQQQERWLNTVRIRLHDLNGRAEERLLFDHQSTLAEQMGVRGKGVRRPAEVLMQRYYRTAQTIRRLNTLLIQILDERVSPPAKAQPLDALFAQRGDLLDLRDPERFAQTPAALFDIFKHWQHQPGIDDLSANVLRALNNAAPKIDHAFRADPIHHQQFIDLFRAPRGILHALRTMNLYGLLGRYLPAFGRIVGQMQHDLFHVYTVDEHTLMLVRNLRRFSRDIYSHEYPLCSRLMADFTRPEVLYLAALFHDIAKGRGGQHAQRGSVIARRFCAQHALPADDAALIVWLVREHLLMSHTAQKQDISDARVVARFARTVGSERRLVALYLLTVADIRATSPHVWNPWKAQLLETLFVATRAHLRQGHIAPAAEIIDSIAEKQQAVRQRLYAQEQTPLRPDNESAGKDPASAEDLLWKTLDTAYFQRHSVDDLLWHTRELRHHLNTPTPIVRTQVLPNAAGLHLLAYLHDQPGLFARLCGFFARHGLNILEARIHTSRHAYALDSFVLHSADPRHTETPQAIEHALTQFLQQTTPSALPAMGRKSRRLKHFPLSPHVQIAPDDAERYLLEITAGDRTGLLAHLAQTLTDAGVNVQSARINTLGERVEDVFLIDGPTLDDPAQRVKLESQLHALLQSP